MEKKAMENLFKRGELRWGMLAVLAIFAAFVAGIWLGGWRESLILRSELQLIPDINQCY